MKLQIMAFVITKHLLMACGHHPVGSSPRPGMQSVPGLSMRSSLTHQVMVRKSLGVWHLFLLL